MFKGILALQVIS